MQNPLISYTDQMIVHTDGPLQPTIEECGAQAAWANKKCHGHCILPPGMTAMVKEMVPK